MHTDPDWYAKYEFCRVDCDECLRLDRIDVKAMTPQQIMQAGFDKAVKAFAAEGPACKEKP